MSYLGDIKVCILSGAIRFLKGWNRICHIKQIEDTTDIKIHDSLYTEEEIKEITNKEYLKLKDINKCDILLVTSDHKKYKE